ncbi:cellulase family glycosylhydrolase [Candidatus Uhrbacteria bacterium]|jgi:hypothetical protein|nr:cellulase family glycosylhydrolase [Candidatus Uhrbacteria bacterium]
MKQKNKKTIQKVLIGALVAVVLVLVTGPFAFPAQTAAEDIEYGATYSAMYAAELGIDPLEGFEAMVEDLGVTKVRIPVYWDRLEAERDVFEWDEIDAMMSIAEANEVDVILAIGQRVPRWPECFFPDWTSSLSTDDLAIEQLDMLESVVNRYKDSSSLLRWQVENEPFLKWFGECPDLDRDFFKRELDLVRDLDSDSPIMTTASGELSSWMPEAYLANEMVGVSVYRTTYTPIIGYATYPIPTWVYRAKAKLLGSTSVIVSELQAEPWYARPFDEYTIQEQLDIFNADDLERNISYAESIGFPEVYVWGVEWWYYMKANDQSELWDAGKSIF